jgi:protein SPT2
MESNFAQVMREEFISKKLGLQEDLEDMRMEEMERKMKAKKRRRLDWG